MFGSALYILLVGAIMSIVGMVAVWRKSRDNILPWVATVGLGVTIIGAICLGYSLGDGRVASDSMRNPLTKGEIYHVISTTPYQGRQLVLLETREGKILAYSFNASINLPRVFQREGSNDNPRYLPYPR